MTDITPTKLPKHGYSRAAQLLPFLPFGSTTLWKWSKEGKFPKPVNIGTAMTAWSNEEVHAWFAQQKAVSDDSNPSQEV